MWLTFLEYKNFKIHREVPFLHFIGKQLGSLIFADASGNPNLGFGCVFPEKGQWTAAHWPVGFFQEKKPDITLLELYAIVVAVEMWAPELRGKQVQLRSDNEVTVYLINAKYSKKEINMNLLRHLTLTCMYFQIYITIWHEPGVRNKQADALSQGAFCTFLDLALGHTEKSPRPLPASLWPISWQKLKNLS